jgi:hypothetical protein
MSHFTEVEVSFDQKNEKEFVAALEKQFGKGSVEVHDGEGDALFGWHGDNRAKLNPNSADYAPPCNIIVRRQHISSASNDIGYKRAENGRYTAYVSDYDKGVFNKANQGLVKQEYGLKVAEKALHKEGWKTKREERAGGAWAVVGVGGAGGKKNW